MAFYPKPGPVAGPRAASPGSDGETAKKPKFDRDFIVLSEFSELVGPVPLVSICTCTCTCMSDPVYVCMWWNQEAMYMSM